MLKKQCSPTLKPIKKSLILIFSGALLITGLFLFLKNKTINTPEISKPSLLSFTDGNEVKTAEKSEVLFDKNHEVIAENELEEQKKSSTEINNSSAYLNKFSEQDKTIWSTLEAVLNSNNDNDPRINLDLKNLSPSIHEALYEKYESIISENRNAKGLIVFLVARDLKSKEDIEFIAKTYQEAPCLSLDDCKNVGSDDAHHSGPNQTTLVYPQLAGLYQIEQQIKIRPEILKDPALRNEIVSLLKQAEDFPVLIVQQKAKEIRHKNNL